MFTKTEIETAIDLMEKILISVADGFVVNLREKGRLLCVNDHTFTFNVDGTDIFFQVKKTPEGDVQVDLMKLSTVYSAARKAEEK